MQSHLIALRRLRAHPLPKVYDSDVLVTFLAIRNCKCHFSRQCNAFCLPGKALREISGLTTYILLRGQVAHLRRADSHLPRKWTFGEPW
jgi:hypothetical protein